MSYVLAHFIEFMNVATANHGFILGFLLWGGLAPGGASVYIFEERPRALFMLNTAYQLVTIFCMSVLLAAWK